MASALIGERLISRSVLSREDLERALQLQASVEGRLGALLVRIGAVSEEQLLLELKDQLRFPLVIHSSELPNSIDIYTQLKKIAIEVDWCIDNSVLIWVDAEENYYFSAKDLLNPYFFDCFRVLFSEINFQPCLMTAALLETQLDFIRKERNAERLFESSKGSKALREMAEEAPVVDLVNSIFSKAVFLGASDIHIEPQEAQFAVRLRVDGVLDLAFEQPMERFPAVSSRIKLISGLDIAERRLPQDGRITSRFNGKEMDVRVSTVPGIHGESVVMRLLPKERENLSLQYLGMEPDHQATLSKLLRVSDGIVLVTGPTGSGKSTTLYAALQDINDGSRKIVTVEDPVEYQLPGITQVQAHAEIGYTFGKALRAFLRQDPDVIMVGEIRDSETAEIAIQSALTGHLVLSTLHTNDALSAFTRLIDMGVEPFLVAAPVKAVQAQRLVRRLCSCAEAATVPKEIDQELDSLSCSKRNWRRSVGCTKCSFSGYKGRLGIYEIVPMSNELHDMVVRNAPVGEMRKLARSQGFRSLYQDGLIKAANGKTTLEEVLRVCSLNAD